MPGDIRPEGLQVTSGPSDRGDLRDQTRGKRQEYCADFTSRFLANSPCSRPTPRARCRVTNSSSTPTTLSSGNSHGACAGTSMPNIHTFRCTPGSSASGASTSDRATLTKLTASVKYRIPSGSMARKYSTVLHVRGARRSEERRVGKEGGRRGRTRG